MVVYHLIYQAGNKLINKLNYILGGRHSVIGTEAPKAL